VLGTAFRIPSGVTVDTHAGRVSRRLGLTRHEDPVKVEQALCALLPREAWIDGGHRLVLHGRYVCTARKPACAQCPLNELCPSAEAPPEGTWEDRAEAERRLVESRGAERGV
jgi:endonuclease-3